VVTLRRLISVSLKELCRFLHTDTPLAGEGQGGESDILGPLAKYILPTIPDTRVDSAEMHKNMKAPQHNKMWEVLFTLFVVNSQMPRI
jgi:hypothetical protein